MDIHISIPDDADVSAIEKEYPDFYFDDSYAGWSHYYVGKSSDEEDGDEFLTPDEAEECCGFCEGAVAGCSTMLGGNGPWAQCQMRANSPQYQRGYAKGLSLRAKS